MLQTRRCCFWCGMELALGALAYQLRIQIAADFDGYIDGDDIGNSLSAGFQAVRNATGMSADELINEVYQERTLRFCKNCAEHAWAIITKPHSLPTN